jgi:hypothetical protein
LGFIASADCKARTGGELVGYFEYFASLLENFGDALLEFGKFVDFCGAYLVEGVQELIHFSVLLVENLIFLLVLFLSLLILQNGL